MAWRRCSSREAFDDLFAASREHGVSVTRLARELVYAVTGARAVSPECARAISRCWGRHFDLAQTGHERAGRSATRTR